MNKISLLSMSTLGKDWNKDLLFTSNDFSYYDNEVDRYINCQAVSINHKDRYKGKADIIHFVVSNM